MATSTCPLCDAPVNTQDRHCKDCGVDLALAAALAEYALASSTDAREANLPVAPEVLVPRVGEYLVEKGIVQASQLQEALTFKYRSDENGHPVLLGQVLIEMGYLDQQTLDHAITEQIFRLQEALKKTNRELENRVQDRTRDLQATLDKLTELNQLKSNFVSNISHELRTPLTHIKGYLELLGERSLGPLTKQQAEAIQVLNRATVRLARLIDDLIKFSETTKGDLTLQLDPVPIQMLVNKVVARSFSKAEARHIFIDIDIPHNLPPVLADEENMTAVLLQLLDNAIKFSPEGSEIAIAGKLEDDRVRISVIDHGIGIPPDQLQAVFEAFHQLDSSSTRRYGGTGLGLALVKRILDAHHSPISVQSTLGKGSVFEFALPLSGSG